MDYSYVNLLEENHFDPLNIDLLLANVDHPIYSNDYVHYSNLSMKSNFHVVFDDEMHDQ